MCYLVVIFKNPFQNKWVHLKIWSCMFHFVSSVFTVFGSTYHKCLAWLKTLKHEPECILLVTLRGSDAMRNTEILKVKFYQTTRCNIPFVTYYVENQKFQIYEPNLVLSLVKCHTHLWQVPKLMIGTLALLHLLRMLGPNCFKNYIYIYGKKLYSLYNVNFPLYWT